MQHFRSIVPDAISSESNNPGWILLKSCRIPCDRISTLGSDRIRTKFDRILRILLNFDDIHTELPPENCLSWSIINPKRVYQIVIYPERVFENLMKGFGD